MTISRVNMTWVREQHEKFATANFQGEVYGINVMHASVIAELCLMLADRGVPYKVIKLGGGVSRVTNDVAACTKCGRWLC